MRWIALSAMVLAFGLLVRPFCGTHGKPAPLVRFAAPVNRPVRTVCAEAGVAFPPRHIFIRVLKQERVLELWGADGRGIMHLLQSYAIAAASGGPGPKRRQGDLQVPEGVYHVDRFNPHSMFHLSLGLNYPNKADRILGDPTWPGGDIFIHGNQVSIGCMAMTDKKIDEIYALASAAEGPIPVHIFPCRMEGAAYDALKRARPDLVPFWRQLEPIYGKFEATHLPPKVKITSRGGYVLG